MDIDEFLDINAPIRRRVIRGPSLDVHRLHPMSDTQNLEQRSRVGTDFSHELKTEQDMKFIDKMKKLAISSGVTTSEDTTGGSTTECESTTDCDTIVAFQEDDQMKNQLELYRRYKFNLVPGNPTLPIHTYRAEILRRVNQSPVVTIKGETGCGKSTQVPQYILDAAFDKREYCNIVVTQPRRIAAITLAEQVSKERGCEKNTLIGYQIGLDRQVHDDTRITYCTTGVLLEKLILRKRMDMYTHIILDEIHERDEDMEFLLIAIKRFMIDNPFMTKIILMSATVQTSQFSKYFRLPCPTGTWLNAPTVRLEGQRQFPIHTWYMEDLAQINIENLRVEYEKPGIEPAIYRMACTIISLFSKPERISGGTCFLLFLPGIHEIAQMSQVLETELER